LCGEVVNRLSALANAGRGGSGAWMIVIDLSVSSPGKMRQVVTPSARQGDVEISPVDQGMRYIE
jgi:hypothetical protein